MSKMSRRDFVRAAGSGATVAAAAGPFLRAGRAQGSPNDTVRVAVMGVRSRGTDHARVLAGLPNVEVAVICDIDERLFENPVKVVEEISGKRPRTEIDIRRVLDDPEIAAIFVAAPNHWHALATIWACQTGKDVYVEKPVSHNISEGRMMVEASRKYNRIVQTGTQRRSFRLFQEAMNFIHSGKLGEPYMAKCTIFRPRESIGRTPNGPVPPGVHYDLWVGPAEWRPFNETRFHYNWHWFWNTGNGETGNNGPHHTDIARWALQKYEHPVRIQSMGGYDVFDSMQETPNTQISVLEYQDGKRVIIDVRGLYTNLEDQVDMGNFIYTSEGYMRLAGDEWQAFYGRKNELGQSMSMKDFSAGENSDAAHFQNFIDCVRSRRREDLNADILEGHYSTTMCHLANIAYRVGDQLEFDSDNENFPSSPEANRYLKRKYRYPFVVEKEIA